MTKKRGCLIILVVVLILSSLWGAMKLYDWYKYTPRLNPHPKYFLTVQGHVDPALKDKIALEWVISYSTNAEECKEVTNYLEGAFAERNKKIYYAINVNSDGTYRRVISIDALNPGFCKWTLDGAYYEYAYNKKRMETDFVAAVVFGQSGETKKSLSQNLLCTSQSCDLATNTDIFGNNTVDIHNSTINLNFLRKN